MVGPGAKHHLEHSKAPDCVTVTVSVISVVTGIAEEIVRILKIVLTTGNVNTASIAPTVVIGIKTEGVSVTAAKIT